MISEKKMKKLPQPDKVFSNSEDIKKEVLGRFRSEKVRFFRKRNLKKKLIVSVVLSSIIFLLMALENKEIRALSGHCPILNKIIEAIIEEEYIEEGIDVYVYPPERLLDVNKERL